MADTKISALTASTTPLAGTEVLPIVQGGVTKQVSVANLTAGRALSATELTLTTGNLVIGTAGKGIDFSADGQAAGMTSELLDDYEEGTYAVNLYDASSAGNASPTTVTGYYTKIGQQVTVAFRNLNDIDTTGMTAANPLYISLPFQSAALAALWVGSVIVDTVNLSLRTQVNSAVENGGSRGTFIYSGTSVSDNFVKVQDLTTGTSDIRGYTMTYFAA
jgi:hypothetical protein